MRPERPSSCRFLAGRISDPVFPIQTVSHGTHHFDPVLHGGKVIEHDDFSIHDLYGASAAHNKLEKLNAGEKIVVYLKTAGHFQLNQNCFHDGV